MYKKFLYLFLILILCIYLTACGKTKSMILFNKDPITRANFLDNSTQFTKGTRIYYLFITQKPIKTEYIRIRVFKREEKGDMTVSSKICYSNDFRLSKDQIYYYNDYIVMNEAGYYQMAVYLLDSLKSPFAVADFRVLN